MEYDLPATEYLVPGSGIGIILEGGRKKKMNLLEVRLACSLSMYTGFEIDLASSALVYYPSRGHLGDIP